MKKISILILFILITIISTNAQQLPNGSVAPNFIAVDVNGDTIELYEIVKYKPVVLTFYRGQWCSHCNNYLSNLQDSLNLITGLVAVLIAITPESNDNIQQTINKTNANFIIIHDIDHKIMDDYQVTWNLSPFKNTMYKMGGLNINKASGNNDRALPVTATYIIDTKRKIFDGYFNKDHKVRMSVAKIVKTLEIIKKRSIDID